MRNDFDLTPYRRSTVGFDRLFDMLESGLRSETIDGFPPFDLEKDGEERYRITLAVAGFRRDEIEVTAQQNQLVITGRKTEEERENGQRFLHRGIAARAFERRFQLADFVQVRSAELTDGLLTVTLEREIPEEMRPRRIEIGAGEGQRLGGSETRRLAA